MIANNIDKKNKLQLNQLVLSPKDKVPPAVHILYEKISKKIYIRKGP